MFCKEKRIPLINFRLLDEREALEGLTDKLTIEINQLKMDSKLLLWRSLSGDKNVGPSGFEKEIITPSSSILMPILAKQSTKFRLSKSMVRYVNIPNRSKQKFSDSSRKCTRQTSK